MQFVYRNTGSAFPKMYIYHFAPYEHAAVKTTSPRSCTHLKKKWMNCYEQNDLSISTSVFKEALLASVEVTL